METKPNRINRLLLPALLLATLLGSCTRDLTPETYPDMQEGVPAKVTLNFRAEENRVETRAAQDPTYENRVNNLYVFIFDPAGQIHYRHFFSDDISYGADNSTGFVSIETTSLYNARVICLANLSTDGVRSGYDVTPAEMDQITSLSELQSYVMYLDERTVERSTQFMMSGYAYTNTPDGQPSEDDTSINIPGAEGDTPATLNCTLRPERADAKVEFIVKTELPADKQWTNFDFRPRSWRVVNVPAQAMLLPQETGDADGDYFTTEEMPFETTKRDQNYLYESGGFVFYMPENRKAPRQTIPDNTDASTRYALREESDHMNVGTSQDKPGQQFENGDFTYAPEHATYVEMSGTLSYTSELQYTVNADVTFTVHLGYANGDPNDYETLRSTHYIYTVTLRGINDIQVEVTSDGVEEEPRPGYEGSVIYSLQGLHEMDAHYDRELILLDRSMIHNMTWGVHTPFDKAIYSGDFSDTDTPSTHNINDYKWIKFAINADYGVDNAHFVKYPGDQNYKGGQNEATPYYKYQAYPNARLLDVHQLLQRLKQEYDAGTTTGQVAITAFVDEYIYVRDPSDSDISDTNTPLLGEWRRYVEAEDRLLYFINGDNSRYSPDGGSSVVEAIHTFKQKSLRTVYNTNKSADELPTAWGLESRMEGSRWAPGNVSNGTSTSNGRLNTIQCILGFNYESNTTVLWDKVLNTDDQYTLQSGYEDALHAVLMRNRDLDGDNIVEPNEIRWYLAAVDQLVDLYIGEYALDDDAHLYPTKPAYRDNMDNWHYTSSSYNSSDTGPWILWAEECVALGSYGASSNTMGGKYAYRCIRNLGIGLDDPHNEPTALIPKVTQAESDGTYLIDATNLSEKSRRQSLEAGMLPTHDDLSPYNRPYGKFRVASANNDYPKPEYEYPYFLPGQELKFTNENKWAYYQTQSITPIGYRTPNLRELLIMMTRLPADAWPTYTASYGWYSDSSKAMYLSYTSFSRRNIFTNKNGGFRFNANNNSIGATETNNDTGYVRGVKDEPM